MLKHLYTLLLNNFIPQCIIQRKPLPTWTRRHVQECLSSIIHNKTLRTTRCPLTGKWINCGLSKCAIYNWILYTQQWKWMATWLHFRNIIWNLKQVLEDYIQYDISMKFKSKKNRIINRYVVKSKTKQKSILKGRTRNFVFQLQPLAPWMELQAAFQHPGFAQTESGQAHSAAFWIITIMCKVPERSQYTQSAGYRRPG